MNKSFDILVPKEFLQNVNGKTETKKVWNRVGRAWPSKSGDSLSFELYLIPNQCYVIQLKEKQPETKTENAPF